MLSIFAAEEHIFRGGVVTAPIIRAIFSKRIPCASREHVRLYDMLIEEYNKLYFEKFLDGEQIPYEKLWSILLLIYTTLKFVYKSGIEEEYGSIKKEPSESCRGSQIRSPYVGFKYYVGTPNIINFQEESLSAASYEIGLGNVAFLVDNEEFINLSNGDLVLEPRSAALVFSREYIILPENMTGIVRTRLALHLRGFAPVSHKLDPCYHGLILFMLYNVTRNKRIYVRKDEAIADVRIDAIPTIKMGETQEKKLLLYWHSYAPETLSNTIEKLSLCFEEFLRSLSEPKRTSIRELLNYAEQSFREKFPKEQEELVKLVNFVLRYLRLQLFKTVLKLNKPLFYIEKASHNVHLLKYLILYEIMKNTSLKP
ncbi:MAG: hypothetical protein GXO26_01390 [Crenarchaeota archaeon]|nr:hypothetical protein [Thermoproteota archaeon]